MQALVSHRITAWLTPGLACLLALLVGCASAPPAPNIVGTGVVQTIVETQQASGGSTAVGAIGGALIGGWLGSQVGGGTGQTIATAAGGVAGSMAGGSVAAKASAKPVWRVTVRFEDGINRDVVLQERPNFRPGDRVLVSGGTVSLLR
jgi:outer membrane lipoprotein SlyB